VLYLRPLDFMLDSFAEGEEEEVEEKKQVPPPPSMFPPLIFWRSFDTNLRQKCHLDESLLVQAGVARHRQKGEFHADQINTDVK